jgi:hypothetical protein
MATLPNSGGLKQRLLRTAAEKIEERRRADLALASRIATLMPSREDVVAKLEAFAEVEGETLEERNEIVCNIAEAALPVGDIYDLEFVSGRLTEFWNKKLNDYLKDDGFHFVGGIVEIVVDDVVRFDVDIRLDCVGSGYVADEGGMAASWAQTLEDADHSHQHPPGRKRAQKS